MKIVDSAARRLWRVLSSTRFRAVMALGMVLGLGAVGTLAAWSDNATATSGAFTIGYVDMKAGGIDTTYTIPNLTTSDMRPGSSNAAVLTVRSDGDLPVTYVAKATANATLAQYLTVSVRSGGTASRTTSTGTCSSTSVLGTAVPTAAGATLYSGRPLGAKTDDLLCVLVTLSPSTPDSMASSLFTAVSATITLTFTGTVIP